MSSACARGLAIAAVAATCFASGAAARGATPTASPGAAALARFAAAWEPVQTYTCTVTAHEVSGTRVQDRVYSMWFRKPYDTRMDVTAGDGRGGAAVWHGGDTLRGHQGGFIISFVKLNLNIHDSRATTIRGTTIAQANFGAILDHVKGTTGTLDTTTAGDKTTIDLAVADPSSDESVTKERLVLGASGLPTEYDQWEGGTLVRRVAYTDLVLDPALTDSDFTL